MTGISNNTIANLSNPNPQAIPLTPVLFELASTCG